MSLKKILAMTFVFGMGINSTTFAQVIDVAASEFHVCSVLKDGRVKCTGSNNDGLLGMGDGQPRGGSSATIGKNLAAVDFGSSGPVKRVFVANNFNCVLFASAKIKCWGNNASGQLGIGTTASHGGQPNQMGNNLPEVNLGEGVLVKDLALGQAQSSCAVTMDGRVKCWGKNNQGKLGMGADFTAVGNEAGDMGDSLPYINLGDINVVQVTVGISHQCVLTDQGKVKCWGINNLGQLGLGDKVNRITADQMGDALEFLNFGVTEKVTQISSKANMTCALFESGRVKCWGNGGLGFTAPGNSIGGEPNDLNEKVPFIDFGTPLKVVELRVGGGLACVTFENGSAKCWGSNGIGALGIGRTNSLGFRTEEMGKNLPFIDLGSTLKAKFVSAGNFTTCALFRYVNEIKCWGNNSAGRLGLGDDSIQNVGLTPESMGDGLPFSDLGD